MKNHIFNVIFCFITVASVAAQDLENYKYVRVPEKFEFLKEENQYQLNALTAFLFEKHGLTPIYKSSVPVGVQPCEILYSNVHNESGLFKTEVYFSLEDCNKEVIFTSESGKSREKDYKIGYHEALRNAFASFDKSQLLKPASKVEPHASVEIKVSSSEVASKQANEIDDTKVEPAVAAAEAEQVITVEPSSKTKVVASPEALKFTNAGKVYTLRESKAGYDLFKADETQKFASLLQSSGGENFLYSSEKVSGNAFFDTSGDLIVEYVEPSAGQLISVRYKRQ